jgi:hypothetical protein
MSYLVQKIFLISSIFVLFHFNVYADVQVFNQNVQSPVSNSVDIPEIPSAPSQPPVVVTPPEPSVEEAVIEEAVIEEAVIEEAVIEEAVIEEAVIEEEAVVDVEAVVDGQGNLSDTAVEQILSGGVLAENALTVFVEAKSLDLSSSSDIDQIVQAIEVESVITPELSTTVVVAVTSAVASNFLEVVDSSSDTFSSDSFVAAVQEATNTIVSSAKLTSLLSVSSAVEVKESMLSLALKVLEENGVSGDDLDAVVKQVEAIISELDNQVTKVSTVPPVAV